MPESPWPTHASEPGPKAHEHTGQYHSDPATRAQTALDAFGVVAVEEYDQRDSGELISDLLTDLMHYADEFGIDFSIKLVVAEGNFEEEQFDEDEDDEDDED